MIEKLLAGILSNKKAKSLIIILAVIIVFVTTYSLILPAVTMENTDAREEDGIVLAQEGNDSETEEALAQDETAIQSLYQTENSDTAQNASESNASEAVSGVGISDGDALEAEQNSVNVPDAQNTGESVGAEEMTADASYPAMTFETEIEREGDIITTEALSAGEEGIVSDESAAYEYDAEGNLIEKRVILKVRVEAEEGAFPEGTTMKVEEVSTDADVVSTVKDAAQTEGSKKVKELQAVDITFFDACGNEIEPAKQIKVTFSSDTIKERQQTTGLEQSIIHIQKDGNTEVIDEIDESKLETAPEEDQVIFEAETFSVYAIVYTVDFSYSADGEPIEFSIPGGSGISIRDLVSTLGIAADDPATDIDELQEFVESITDVSFTNPNLVWLGTVVYDNTIADIKEYYALECEYSSDLTEEQIAEINARQVFAGEWALISLKPFTSEEALTISLENGEQFVVKVTDGQKTSTSDLQQGDKYIIYIIKHGNYYALNRNGETYQVSGNDLDSLGSDYLWTYSNQENGNPHFNGTATWENGDNFLDVYWSRENPDQEYYWVNKYYPLSPISKGWQPIIRMVPDGNGGFYFRDLNDNNRYLANSNENHVRTIEVNSFRNWYHTDPPAAVPIYIYKQGSTYMVRAQSNDNDYGHVEYTHNGVTNQTSAENLVIEIKTNSTEGTNKTVPDNIVAVPANGYVFDGWTVIKEEWENSHVSDWGQGSTASSLTIKPTVDGSLTLQANFRPERQYHFTVRVSDDAMGTVGYVDGDDNQIRNLNSFESESEAVINNASSNKYKITTDRKPMYKFLHWELRNAAGEIVTTYTEATLDPGDVALTEDGMQLVAVYARKKDNEIDNIDINDFLDEWKETMLTDFTGVDKTASVYDPANRIFQIDLTASSAKWEMERSLSLDFITDTSRSMFFPANLEYAKDTYEASHTTDIKSWLQNNGVDGDVYYVISDDNSATVFALFKEGNKWYYMDSSYYYYEESGAFSGTAQKREVPNGLHFSKTGGTNDGSGKTMTGVIYVSSDATDTYTSHTGTSMGQVYWSRLDYLYKAVEVATTTLKAIDPTAQISLTTFNAKSERIGPLPDNKEAIYSILRRISPSGGTRQDRGLLTSMNGINYNGNAANSGSATESGANVSQYGSAFSQGSDKKQVAILISDGAPNNPPNGWGDITPRAEALRGIIDSSGENLLLMTLGLSLNFVHDEDLRNFKGIATGGADGGYAINANSGAEIVESIKTLVKSLVEKADLYGTATDTLDPAFYPVMADGTPIEDGACFSTPHDVDDCCDTGHYLGTAPPTGNTPYLQWTKNGEVWTVTYYNQTFEWAETDTNGNVIEPGWKKSFYTKAKEDFLGGNTIETNVGNATVRAEKCIVHGTTEPRPLKEAVEKTVESPHVNVKELAFAGNDTKWTVYIETEVKPIDQIKELYKNIKVLEVVSDSEDRMITSKDDMLYEQETGNLIAGKTPETFYLKDIIPLENADWDSILANGYVDKPYSRYGHATGNIRISLTKSGNHADYDSHKTSSVIVDKEEYVLTAQYIPYSVADMVANDSDGGRYHTTKGVSPGDEIRSGRPCNNTHIIDLFVRGLSITKTNEDFKTPLPGAEFSLYHLATAEEIALNDGKLYEIEGEKYYPEELSFDDSGVAYKNGIRATGSTTKYYLVETKAPEGYDLLEGPIPVTLDLTNTYTVVPVSEGGTPVTQTTKPESGLYNWEEKALLVVSEDYGVMRTTGAYDPDNPETDLTHTSVEPSSLYEVMYYRIANNPGVVLPATGGPGTKLIYLIGVGLTAVAVSAIIMRRRKKA